MSEIYPLNKRGHNDGTQEKKIATEIISGAEKVMLFPLTIRWSDFVMENSIV